MSLPSEIANKFQELVDDWTLGMQILADHYGGAENDNANLPIAQSDTAYATCLVRADSKICSDHPSAPYTQLGVMYKVGVSVTNGVASISDFQNLGRCADDGMTYNEELTQRLMDDINNWFTPQHYFINPLHSGHCYFKFQTYNANMMLSLRYGDPEVESTTQTPIRSIKRDGTYIDTNENLCYVQLNAVEYTINSNNKVQTSINSFGLMQTEYSLKGLKGYPVIMNCDNDYYINKYITDNNATHNYSGSYTTPNNETINYYYGDNYIITNNSGNVSYNDVKHVIDTAVNKINEDNNTNIKVPTYNDNKYGDNMDKNHEIDMPVSKYSTASGMVYYYQLEPDDVWKVRDGLNTINLDPLVLKDVTRNLISYKLFALDKTVLMDDHTPVIVHIGGREIKYNDNSIPAEYVKTVKDINLGAINISRIYHDYRDFSPYVKLELFVPFCGWTSLPSWCMDTTITGTMFIDLMNGSCKAVIKANSTVVCEMGGVCAYDVPFVADATGSKASSMLAKVATTAGAVASGNPLAIATTGISLAATMNDNYTRMMGVCGDGSNINGLDRMYVKITRVSWTNPFQIERPDIYKHTYGIPCGKSLTLSEGDGFTQINDANITGAMTDREKQIITDGFRHGLIL